MRLHDKRHFRGLGHNQQVAVQVHRTPSIATGSVSFLVAEDYFQVSLRLQLRRDFSLAQYIISQVYHIPRAYPRG